MKNEPKMELIKNYFNIRNLICYPKNFEFYLEFFNEQRKIKKINFTYYGMYYGNADNCKEGVY